MTRLLIHTAVVVALVGLLIGGGLNAQSPVAIPTPAFEVASVKRNTAIGGSAMGTMPGGQLRVINIPLRQIIVDAYSVFPFQVVDGPDWIDNTRFDINAKPETKAEPDQVNLMLRRLLTERFKLAIHRETRDMPVYALALTRSDGRLGPRLTKSDVDCAARRNAGPSQPGPPPPGERRPCSMSWTPGRISGSDVPLSRLARVLAQSTGRFVLDETGLAGVYTFDVESGPDNVRASAPGVAAPDASSDTPSLFTALQEQLGLRLKSQRGPVEVIVVDRVEQPTED